MEEFYGRMVVIGAVFVLTYTFIGGFLAETMSDFIQGTLMFIVLILVLTIGTIHAGGLSGLAQNLKNIPGFVDFFGIAVPVDASGAAVNERGRQRSGRRRREGRVRARRAVQPPQHPFLPRLGSWLLRYATGSAPLYGDRKAVKDPAGPDHRGCLVRNLPLCRRFHRIDRSRPDARSPYDGKRVRDDIHSYRGGFLPAPPRGYRAFRHYRRLDQFVGFLHADCVVGARQRSRAEPEPEAGLGSHRSLARAYHDGRGYLVRYLGRALR